jgi:hypothetical protein
MLKILGSAAIAGTIFSALQTATAPPAGALDRYVELINNSTIGLCQVCIFSTSDGCIISRHYLGIWMVDSDRFLASVV